MQASWGRTGSNSDCRPSRCQRLHPAPKALCNLCQESPIRLWTPGSQSQCRQMALAGPQDLLARNRFSIPLYRLYPEGTMGVSTSFSTPSMCGKGGGLGGC